MIKPSQTTSTPMPADPLPPLFASLPEDLRQGKGMTTLVRILGFAATVSPSDRVMTLEDTDELRQALPLED